MGEKYNRASQRAAGGKGRKNTQHFRGQRNTHRQMERKKERKRKCLSPNVIQIKKGEKLKREGKMLMLFVSRKIGNTCVSLCYVCAYVRGRK